MKRVLILCTGNSCRSQMAEGYLRCFAGDRAAIYSAGVEVHGLNPRAVEVMAGDGVDISAQTSIHVDEYRDVDFDYIITVCDHARENCPYIPSKHAVRQHQGFADPAGATGTPEEIRRVFEKVRDEIKSWCREFADTYLSEGGASKGNSRSPMS